MKKVSIGCLSSAPGWKFRAIRSKDSDSNSKYEIVADSGDVDGPGATTSSTQGKNGSRDLQRYADLETTTGQRLSKFTGIAGVTPSACTGKAISPCRGLSGPDSGISCCGIRRKGWWVGYTRSEDESRNTRSRGYEESKAPNFNNQMPSGHSVLNSGTRAGVQCR